MGGHMSTAEVDRAQDALYAMAKACVEYAGKLQYVGGPSVSIDDPSCHSRALEDLKVAVRRHEMGEECDDEEYAAVHEHHDRVGVDGRERCRDHLADTVLHFLSAVRSDVACNVAADATAPDAPLDDLLTSMRVSIFEGEPEDEEFDVCDAFRHLTFRYPDERNPGAFEVGMLVDLHVHKATLPKAHARAVSEHVQRTRPDSEAVLKLLSEIEHDTSVVVASISLGDDVRRVPLLHAEHARVPQTCVEDIAHKAQALQKLAGATH